MVRTMIFTFLVSQHAHACWGASVLAVPSNAIRLRHIGCGAVFSWPLSIVAASPSCVVKSYSKKKYRGADQSNEHLRDAQR
jgi:hypothetical protein